MAVRRVFVIWTNPLFNEFVRLLLIHPSVEMVGDASDHALAQVDIGALHPDTVVVEVANDNLNLVMDILKASQGSIRIIGLNLTDNALSLYQHQQQMMAKAEDFLGVLLNPAN
jgi:AmiR/NasT family two-component response regulator